MPVLLQDHYAYVLLTNQIVEDQCNFRPAGHLLTSYPMQSYFLLPCIDADVINTLS